jgi:hypothetical protein
MMKDRFSAEIEEVIAASQLLGGNRADTVE